MKVNQAYEVISFFTLDSATTADIKASTPPARAKAVMLTARTTTAYVGFDGTDPDSTTHSFDLVAGAAPQLFPFIPLGAADLKIVSSAAAHSIVRGAWLA